MDSTSLGDRMKGYEGVPRHLLTRRMPVIIRLDGKAFHTLTKKLDKPYDVDFRDCMMKTAEFLVENVMGCKLAYVQSDEISLLLIDYEKFETEPWFKNNIQKIVSVSASFATAKFNELYRDLVPDEKKVADLAFFDARVWNLPREEVNNYFLWRQNDATRNSIQGLGQANFSHKKLQGKSCNNIQEMLLLQKDINWNDVEPYFKRGGCVYRGVEGRIAVKQSELSDERKEHYKTFMIDMPKKVLKSRGYSEVDIDDIMSSVEIPETVDIGHGYEYRKAIIVDMDIPIFKNDLEYIGNHVKCNDDGLYLRCIRDIASDILPEPSNGAGGIESIGVIIKDPEEAEDFHNTYNTQGCEE